MAEKKKKLICPICFANNDVDVCCVKKNCAWWESLEEVCSLLVIARLAVRMLNRTDMEART